MDIGEALQTYFAAEKLTGIVLAIYGVVLLGCASFFYQAHTGGFMWGIVVPLALVGLAAVIGGSVLAVKTGPQLAALTSASSVDLLATELPRMAKVNANWVRLEATWTVLIVISLATLWISRRDWANGLGLVLLIVATSAMVLDVLAERRARIYTAALERLGS